MENLKWSVKFPSKEGFYWFYGQPQMGFMGSDFADNSPKIKPEMFLIEIWKISNGFLGVVNGHTFSSTKFNKQKGQAGYIGYFAEAKLPPAPKDLDMLFI